MKGEHSSVNTHPISYGLYPGSSVLIYVSKAKRVRNKPYFIL